MKLAIKALLVAATIASGSFLTGCATPAPLGLFYTQVTVPVSVGDGNIKFSRKGESKAISLFGVFAGGDASINAACANGNINKVAWVNQEIRNILGVYGEYKTIVYGSAE